MFEFDNKHFSQKSLQKGSQNNTRTKSINKSFEEIDEKSKDQNSNTEIKVVVYVNGIKRTNKIKVNVSRFFKILLKALKDLNKDEEISESQFDNLATIQFLNICKEKFNMEYKNFNYIFDSKGNIIKSLRNVDHNTKVLVLSEDSKFYGFKSVNPSSHENNIEKIINKFAEGHEKKKYSRNDSSSKMASSKSSSVSLDKILKDDNFNISHIKSVKNIAENFDDANIHAKVEMEMHQQKDEVGLFSAIPKIFNVNSAKFNNLKLFKKQNQGLLSVLKPLIKKNVQYNNKVQECLKKGNYCRNRDNEMSPLEYGNTNDKRFARNQEYYQAIREKYKLKTDFFYRTKILFKCLLVTGRNFPKFSSDHYLVGTQDIIESNYVIRGIPDDVSFKIINAACFLY